MHKPRKTGCWRRLRSRDPEEIQLIEGYREEQDELLEMVMRFATRRRNAVAWGATAVRSEETEHAAFKEALEDLKERAVRRRGERRMDRQH